MLVLTTFLWCVCARFLKDKWNIELIRQLASGAFIVTDDVTVCGHATDSVAVRKQRD